MEGTAMRQIGIITLYHNNCNYGGALQAYALNQAVRELGYGCRTIDYVPTGMPLKEKLVRKIRTDGLTAAAAAAVKISSGKISARIGKAVDPEAAMEIRIRESNVAEFRKKRIPHTGPCTTEYITGAAEAFDMFLCGSDQIWGGTDDIFYLQFGDSTVKRLAYAPSFGGLQPNKQLLLKIKEYLTDFTFVSSRERKGVELLQSLGYNEASLVPDPTILLSVSAYRDLESSCLAEDGKYLLLYLLGNEIPLEVNSIFDFAAKYGLKVKYVASQGRMDHYPKLYPTIEEWLELVDKASYVITNSFHGTVFSLTFNTPFLVIPVSGVVSRMNNRISDLLVGCNLKERIYQKSLNEIFLPIDFSCFNRNKGKNRAEIQNLFTQLLFEK